MKTNFKTLALQAGIGAALAAGSMSASAVITAVPAPAQLVPLFYYATGIDTSVNVIVPKSVGSDTVINILRGDSGLDAQTNWNSAQQFATTKQIHYWVMDVNSNEIHNDKFTVTPDDEVYFQASDVLGTAAAIINTSTVLGAGVASGQPTYLLLTTEAALNGGNPDFLFAAQAWLENNDAQSSSDMASAVSIPVLGLADAADTTNYPTPGNNVIEAYSGSAGGPIASPIHTGIRTSGTGNGANLRVVNVPVYDDGDTLDNTIVAWTDGNDIYDNIKLYNCNNVESCPSRGTISLPDQLNFIDLGNTSGSNIGLSSGYTSYLSNTNLANGGFLKMVIPAVTLPADWTEAGSYNSVVMFSIPAGTSGNSLDGSELAIDNGWFSGQ